MGLTLAIILLSCQPCLWLRYTSQPQTTVLHWFGEVVVIRVMASNTNSSVDSDFGWVLPMDQSLCVCCSHSQEKSEYAVVLIQCNPVEGAQKHKAKGIWAVFLDLSRGCCAISRTRNHRAFGFLALGNILAAPSSIHWPVYAANGMYLLGL